MVLIALLAGVTAYSTYQRSTLNKYSSDLAIDGDKNTCSQTGYDIGSWWWVDLGTYVNIHGISIQGQVIKSCVSMCACLCVRVRVCVSVRIIFIIHISNHVHKLIKDYLYVCIQIYR